MIRIVRIGMFVACAALMGLATRHANAISVETVITTEAMAALLPPGSDEPDLEQITIDPDGNLIFINSDGPFEAAFDTFAVYRANINGAMPATPEILLDRGQLDAFYGSSLLTANLYTGGLTADEDGRVYLSLRQPGGPPYRHDILRITPGVTTSTLEFLSREHPDFPSFSDGVGGLAVSSPTLYAARDYGDVTLGKNQRQDSITSFSSVAPAFDFVTNINTGQMLVNESNLLGASGFNTSTSVCVPNGLAFDPGGNLLVLDAYSTSTAFAYPNGIVRVSLPSGAVSLVKSGAAMAAELAVAKLQIVAIAVDPSTGDIYIARRRDPAGSDILFIRIPGGAGTAEVAATNAQVQAAGNFPPSEDADPTESGLAWHNGYLYFSNIGPSQIYRVSFAPAAAVAEWGIY